MLAQKAVAAGLSVKPYIKTSLSPGSGVVTYYLKYVIWGEILQGTMDMILLSFTGNLE